MDNKSFISQWNSVVIADKVTFFQQEWNSEQTSPDESFSENKVEKHPILF